MQPPQHSRINLAELKSQIIKRLGPERSKQYLYYLNRLLSLKVSKSEFNKLCLQIVGRENIPLHNQFICSILKNACNAEVPPPIHNKGVLKSKEADTTKEPHNDGFQPSGPHTSRPLVLFNGDLLPLSPRKARSGNRDRRVGDRLTPRGPNGKTEFASKKPLTTNTSDFNGVLENGDLTPSDTRWPVQHHQGITEKLEHDSSVSVHSKDQIASRSLLRAPLGIPLCPVSAGGAHRVKSFTNGGQCSNHGDLLKTETLRERMNLIASSQGLEGVSKDSANLLNSGLEAYLKGLIQSCIDLVGAKSGCEPKKNSANKDQARGKLVNGAKQGYLVQEQITHCPISFLDFRVAMELNPQQLGEDWPLLLEKICTQAFEE